LGYQLQILNGKRQGEIHDLSKPGDLCVGQRETAQVRLDDPWVSWDHARLYVNEERFWVEDLASTNGTFVNCERVQRASLSHDDIVFFGKTHALFVMSRDAVGDSAYQRGLDIAAGSQNVWGESLGLPPQESAAAEPRGSRRATDPFASGEDFELFSEEVKLGTALFGPADDSAARARRPADSGAPPSAEQRPPAIDELLNTSELDGLDELLGERREELPSLPADLVAGERPASPPPPPPPPPPPAPPGLRGPDATMQLPSIPGVASPSAAPELEGPELVESTAEIQALSAPELARRVSLLQAENNRLRSTVAAAGSGGARPEAVREAAALLRDAELARLSQELAETCSKLRRVEEELEARCSELDAVTEQMIAAEDLIEGLKEELGQRG
jgi:hypothetical protein